MRISAAGMVPRSLRWRLLLLSALVVIPALALLAWQLSHIFEQSVPARRPRASTVGWRAETLRPLE